MTIKISKLNQMSLIILMQLQTENIYFDTKTKC